MPRLGRLAPVLLLALLVGCASPATPRSANQSRGVAAGEAAAARRINRTRVMAGRSERPTLASRPLRSFGLSSTTVSRIFNAGLALKDGEGNYHPSLAETLPRLNTESWKVFPGSRMETTYRLRPNLVWHDGQRLTADDFVYAFQLYTHPEIGLGSLAPIGMMEYDVSELVWPASLSSDAQMRNTHPSLSATGGQSGELRLVEHTIATMPTAQNRWQGTNRGGWTNPEFDRLAEQFKVTLDRAERNALLAQMPRVLSEEAAVISLSFNPTTTAFASSLRSPKPAIPDGTMSWNIHEWEWVS